MKNKQLFSISTSMTVFCAVLMLSFLSNCSGDGGEDKDPGEPIVDEPKVVKTNPIQIYMHYMPWFQSKAHSGYWGSHWKMANKNPEIMDENGKRQIASHYYPLIGPYDSRDPDVLEYHLLLMKYSGVDAVLIDWYGSNAANDYRVNLAGANALIDLLDDTGLKFAIVYEEYTAGVIEEQTSKTAIQAAQADMTYAQQNYFTKKEYLKFSDIPLLLTFGPRFFKQESKWTEIFSVLPVKPKFLPLWNHGAYTGSLDNGEFSWVDFNSSLSDLNLFYNRKAQLNMMIGSAFPRFHDFYEQGGWGASYGYVDPNDGETFENTLNKAADRDIDYLQLVTWNDFGEGTVIEPTLEDEFQNLLQLQQFTGVTYGLDELQLIHQYYLKKKELKGNAEAAPILTQVFKNLASLNVEKATELLNQLD